MSVGLLGKLFGSQTRVKLLRLFLFNPGVAFDPETAARRIKSLPAEVGKEFSTLLSIGLLKRKSVYRQARRKRGRQSAMVRQRVAGAALRSDFPYIAPLQRLLLYGTLTERELERRIKKAGRLKLLVISGLFLGEWDSRLDALIVADKVKMRLLDRILRTVEAELGRELRYVVFTPADFNYRMGVNDRLVRDVFDYPHRVVVDRLGIH